MPALDIGIDYAWSHPSTAAILGYGAKWVARYLCASNDGKRLIPSERKLLHDAGLGIALVYEDETGGPLKGYAHGVDDASRAVAQAKALGLPIGLPIFYAIDFDATPGNQTAINAYLDGCAYVHSEQYAVGAYGGYYSIRRSFDAGKIRYGWQTYAWSGGQWDGRAQLRQVRNGITVGTADCDRNERWSNDAGVWYPGGTGAPTMAGEEGMAKLSSGELDVVGVIAAGVCYNGFAADAFPERLKNFAGNYRQVPAGNNIATVRNEADANKAEVLEAIAKTGVTLTDSQVQQLGGMLLNGLSEALGGMVQGIADAVASEMSARLGKDA